MTVDPPLPPGATIASGITVIDHLRRGEDLDVYDCWSVHRYSRCIVKTVRPDRAGSRGTRRRLAREGRLLMSFSHPHLVRAYDYVRHGPRGVPVLVLETLTGATLSHVLRGRQRRLPVDDLAHLGRHLCSAIRYLHDHGYLHLDLKPSNIIAEGGRAKVIDLSLARRPGHARAGRGTSTHMSPEQAQGGELTTAADVWGVGLVLYEAATLDRPFDDGSDTHTSPDPLLQLVRAAPPIRALRRLPRALAATLDACLDTSPNARPTLAELDDALTGFAAPMTTGLRA